MKPIFQINYFLLVEQFEWYSIRNQLILYQQVYSMPILGKREYLARELNLLDFFESSVLSRPNSIALRDASNQRQITFRNFNDKTNQLARFDKSKNSMHNLLTYDLSQVSFNPSSRQNQIRECASPSSAPHPQLKYAYGDGY